MVDLKILEAAGITQDNLRLKLQGDPLNRDLTRAMIRPMTSDPDELTQDTQKVHALLNRIRSRIQEGMTRNLADFRHYYALDQAWDLPFRQVSATLLSTMMDKNPSEDEVYKAFKDWGLAHLITEKQDPKDPTKKIREINLPIFFNVFVPLVRAYVTIRWAKIMNDRRLTPFFEYVPAKLTGDLMAKCAAITDRVQVMSNQYGYYDVQKQAVLKMLHYSQCFQFVKEAWHVEETQRYATADDVKLAKKNAEGTAVKEGDVITVTDREGIRYHLPHPTRVFYDLASGPYTLNYDSGTQFIGYWRIERYRNIENSNFWNKDKVALGSIDLVSGNPLFFQTVYSACTMTIPIAPQPKMPEGPEAAAAFGVGTGVLDRERQIAQLYYGTEHGDQGVLVTEYFEKLVPSDWGLGKYDYPLWFRFCVAGDGCTVLYAEPLPSTPAVYYGYDADESRSMNASMSLEILPFQDQFSNVLTQIILTAKQNLANFVFVDECQVEQGFIDTVKNIGEKMFRKLNVFKYNSKNAAKFQTKVADAFQSFKFPQGNTAELTNVLKTILDVLERVLVMSSNEVGQAASHEQTREEIRNIASNTSSRLVFTTTPVDIAAEAQKRQLYCGLMMHGDDDIFVHIPSDFPLTKDALETLGFTYADRDVKDIGPKKQPYLRYRVNKKKTAMSLWEFASTRDQQDRINDEKIALALAQLFDKIMSNPLVAPAIGADQAIDWANQICYFAGLPRDFKLRSMTEGQDPQQQQAQAQAQLADVAKQVLSQVEGGLKEDLQPVLEEVKNNSRDIALIMKFIKESETVNPKDETDPASAAAPLGAPS